MSSFQRSNHVAIDVDIALICTRFWHASDASMFSPTFKTIGNRSYSAHFLAVS